MRRKTPCVNAACSLEAGHPGKCQPKITASARIARNQPAEAVVNAPGAIRGATARRQKANGATMTLLSPITSETPISTDIGPKSGSNGSASTFQTSKPSDEPTNASKPHWRRPTNVQGLAAQVNAVATQVLNGEVEDDVARIYASLTRTLAAFMSSEVSRARYLKEEPILELGDDVLDG